MSRSLPPLLSTLTSPLFDDALPLRFRRPLGSRLCLLLGLSLSSDASFRFLLNRARSSGRNASLTILLFFLDDLGVAAARVTEDAEDVGVGALIVIPVCLGVGREDGAADGRGEFAAEGWGEGAAEGRGDGAADGRGDDADAGPTLVLILSLVVVVGRGIGELIAGGVEIPVGILTAAGVGRGGAAAGGGGAGTGVWTTGAGVAGLDGGATTGGDEICGVAVLDSGFDADGVGAGVAFVDSGIGCGELTAAGESMMDCCLDLGAPVSIAEDGGEAADLPSFRDSFGFGTASGGSP